MKRLLLTLIFILLSTSRAMAQSTDVSATVTDNAGQAWIGGTYSFKSLSPQQAPFNGVLDSIGSFAVTLPHNQFTQAVNDVWTFQACPDVSIPAVGNGCFTTNVTIFGPTQSLTSQVNAIAPALTIPLFPAAISTIRAYTDAEIVSAPKGAVYYNVILQQERICTVINGTPTVPTCTTWVANGGGGGPGGTPRLDQVLDPNINKTFNLGTTTLAFINGNIDLSGLTSPLKLPLIASCATASAGQICFDTFIGNWHIHDVADSIIMTALASGSYTTGNVLGISNVGGKLSVIDLGPVNGTSGNSFVQITTTNILEGDIICWDGSTGGFVNCTPGVPVSVITATSYTVDCVNDRGSYLLFTAATAISVSLPQASTSGNCDANFFTFIRTLHAQLTVTPTTSTIDDGGGAGTTLVMYAGYGFTITSDPAGSGTYTAKGGPARESGLPLMSVEGFDVNTLGGYDWQTPNASPATVLHKMACDNGSGAAIICPSASATTDDPLGVAVNGIGAAPGSTGNTGICLIGYCPVVFDNTATANHYAQVSPTVDGDLHDVGASKPTNGQPYYFIYSGNTGAGTEGVIRNLTGSELNASSGGGGGGNRRVQVNGTTTQPLANFNSSTPAPGAGFLATTYAVSNSGNTTNIISKVAISGNTSTLASAGTISGTSITCGDGSGNITTVGCVAGSSGYSTIQGNGTALTQRATLNLISGGTTNVSCVDNSGATKTDCTITGVLGSPAPAVFSNPATSYTIQNSENTWRNVFNAISAVSVTLPQANTNATSAFVSNPIFTAPTCSPTCTTATFAQTALNQLLIVVQWNTTSNLTSVTDSIGDTCGRLAPDQQSTTGGQHFSTALFYCPSIAATAVNTVIVTFNATTATQIIGVYQYTGLTLDHVNQAKDTQSPVTVPVSFPSDLAIAVICCNETNAVSPGWTSRSSFLFQEINTGPVSNVTYVPQLNPVSAINSIIIATFAQSSTPVFTQGWFSVLENQTNKNVVVTPTTSNIQGRTTLTIVPNEWCAPMSDAANYNVVCGFMPNVATNGVMGGIVEIAGVNTANTGADIGTTTLIGLGAADAFYEVKADITCRTAVAGTETITITYTDTSNTAQTLTGSAACTALGGSSIVSIVQSFRAKASTNFQYATSHTGSQPTYDVSVGLYQLSTL